MMDVKMIKRKASGIKHRFMSRFRRVQYGEDPRERDVRPLLRTAKKTSMAPWDEPEQLLSLNRKLTGGKGNKHQMSSFATSGSAIIATTFSEDTNSTHSSTHANSLYRQQKSPTNGPRIVHPVVCKRDMYVGLHDDGEMSVNSKYHPVLKTVSEPGGYRESNGLREPRGKVPKDFRNETREESLPSYSIAASMICGRHDEGGKIMPSTHSTSSLHTRSNNRASGVPPNTIMASMLFQALQLNSEKTSTLKNADSQDDEEVECENAIPQDIAKHRDYEPSTVSSMTMYSSYQNDPVARASTNLYNILFAKTAVGQANQHPGVAGLFEV